MRHLLGWPSWWRPQRTCPRRRCRGPSAPRRPSEWRTAGHQNYKTTHTHKKKNTHHSKLHSSRWLGTVFSGKAQMAWNITRNERSAETERERWQGARERSSMLRPGLLEEDRSTETGREKGEMGQRFVRCSADRLAFGRQRGAVRRPAGAGQHSAVFQSGSEKAT